MLHVDVPGRPGLSSKEQTRWAAFERMEGPLDGRRIDHAAAQISQMLVALQTPKGKTPPKLDKFLAKWEPQEHGSGLALLHKVIMMNKLHGGTDERNMKLPEEGS